MLMIARGLPIMVQSRRSGEVLYPQRMQNALWSRPACSTTERSDVITGQIGANLCYALKCIEFFNLEKLLEK